MPTKEEIKGYAWTVVGVVGTLVILTALVVPLSMKFYQQLFPEASAKAAAAKATAAASAAQQAAADAGTAAHQAQEQYRRIRR